MAIAPGSANLRLLTRQQYNNTIRDLLGDDSRPADQFPAEPQQGGFDNNAELHRANALLVEKYLEVAESLATRVVEARLAEVAPCADGEPLADCVQRFVVTFGRQAFRRPLAQPEIDIFLALSQQAPDNYKLAVLLVLEAFLQSPQFLYREEASIPATEETGAISLGSFELASRLSYFLWDSMPDEQLLVAAERDELKTDQEIEAQARRLLEDPRARDAVSNFHRQWALLDGFRDVVRTQTGVTTEGLASVWRESLQLFLDTTFWNDGALSAVFLSPTVFVNSRLAKIYGAVAPTDPLAFEAALLPDARTGLLTQPALLALLALPEQTSPIRRGVFLREHILCDDIPPPPPTVNPTPPDPDPNLTTRERFRVHTDNPDCANCHSLIDPVGFGFEGYDQLGRYRATENGLPVDVSGQITAAPEPELEAPFNGVPELSEMLATSKTVEDCWATHWYRFAMGRIEMPADQCSLDAVKSAFHASGGNLRELLVQITLSDAFRYRPPLDVASGSYAKGAF